MITPQDFRRIEIFNATDLIIENAKKTTHMGKSLIDSREERVIKCYDEQKTGHIGEAGLSIRVCGSIEPYIQHQKDQEEAWERGEKPSRQDYPGLDWDIKTRHIKAKYQGDKLFNFILDGNGKGFPGFDLWVREDELNDNFIYIQAFTNEDLDTLGDPIVVYLAGFASGDRLRRNKDRTDPNITDRYAIRVKDLTPIDNLLADVDISEKVGETHEDSGRRVDPSGQLLLS